MKKFPFTRILGWSASRYDIFSSCKRRYFYTYYAKFDTEYSVSEIAELKSLTTAPLEIGNIAHDTIEDILQRLVKSNAPIDRDKLNNFIKNRTQEYCNGKQFFETYYNQLEEVPLAEIASQATNSINLLLDSDRFRWILERPVAARKNWIIEPDGYGETRINDLKAYCKVDFLLSDNGKAYIMDWKTGRKDIDKHKKQLIGYSLFAQHNLDYKEEDIIPIVVYLKDSFEEEVFVPRKEEIESFFDTIQKETDEMQSLNIDIYENTPKPKEEFEMTSSTALCAYCSFKKLCNR
jgi:hypothetical protein